MRLSEQEKGFVKNTRIRISGERMPVMGADGAVKEHDTLDPIPYAIVNAARNTVGAVLFADFVPTPTGDAWSLTDWADQWPALRANPIAVFDAVDQRAGHLLWVAGRFHRRYCC